MKMSSPSCLPSFTSRTMMYWSFVTLTCMVTLTQAVPVEQYMRARQDMLQNDKKTSIGHQLIMSKAEQKVSDYMVNLKTKMIEDSRKGGKAYYPSFSFYRSKPLMENTPIFNLIKLMPKGAALHLHDLAIGSLDWLVRNVTYRKDVYMCTDAKKNNVIIFKFFKSQPKNTNDCVWKLVEKERQLHGNTTLFDESIKKNMSLLSTDPFVTYPSLTEIWSRFMQYFEQVTGMIFYAPVLKDYFKQTLKEFMDDNVQYIEMRGLFNGVYDFAGNEYSAESILKLYQEATDEFLKQNPSFFGAKFINSGIRAFTKDSIGQEVKTTVQLHEKYPNSMLGYDLVGQEDPNNALLYYRDELLAPSQMSPPKNLPYFFHAAETNWQGTETDYNLIDAILLNATRIGHGFGLVKHPSLVKLVKEKGIAVEVNPISNQLLGLVKDPRNHALVPLMADDLPLVISSDDPATWEAAPLSHDFYIAFMNMCGEDADLRFLKKLAKNSIQYSAMTSEEKVKAMKMWEQKWDSFIEKAVASIHPEPNGAHLAFDMHITGIRSLFGKPQIHLSLIPAILFYLQF